MEDGAGELALADAFPCRPMKGFRSMQIRIFRPVL